MKAKILFTILMISLLFAACSEDNEIDYSGSEVSDPDTDLTDEVYTNRWIYDQMSRVYLWNDALPASPDYTQNPDNFFYSILYRYGEVSGDRFSWIEEDKSKKTTVRPALYTDGTLGFDCIPMSYFPSEESESSSVGLFVITVDEGSDAHAKGLRRGQVIYQVNGTNIDYNNYATILGNLTSCMLGVYNNQGEQEVLPPFHAFAPSPSPVFISKVITSSNVKIGYLMYNAFERSSTDRDDSFEYDIALAQSIRDLKERGITEFVLDLRYNLGGYATSAINLASALVPDRSAEKIFYKKQYNAYFADSLKKIYGEDVFNIHFYDRVYGTDVEIPKLNLSRLYVIATDYSASASELVIHGLRSYMDVYHIGLTTIGKDKASITIKSDDERVLWQLQPLICRITDANGVGDYIYGLAPNYEISEWAEGYQMLDAYYEDENGNRVVVQLPFLSPWKGGLYEMGDPQEPLLATAIAQITGVPRIKSLKTAAPVNWVPKRVPHPIKPNKKAMTLIDKW
jgi:C-terminal processing protease CtpA/Prc